MERYSVEELEKIHKSPDCQFDPDIAKKTKWFLWWLKENPKEIKKFLQEKMK